MSIRVVERIDGWGERPFRGGYDALRDLAAEEFSGVVRAGGAECYLTVGTIVGVRMGTIEDFADASGTAHEAPHPALPLLAIMQEAGADVRAQYYTEDTSISEVDRTLSGGGFSGFLELSENVLSGDYFVAYHGGESMSVAFVGESEKLLTDDEAFETADDEVGIYKVRQVDVEPIEIPEGDGESDSAAAVGSSTAETADAGATEVDEAEGAVDDSSATDDGPPADAGTGDPGSDDGGSDDAVAAHDAGTTAASTASEAASESTDADAGSAPGAADATGAGETRVDAERASRSEEADNARADTTATTDASTDRDAGDPGRSAEDASQSAGDAGRAAGEATGADANETPARESTDKTQANQGAATGNGGTAGADHTTRQQSGGGPAGEGNAASGGGPTHGSGVTGGGAPGGGHAGGGTNQPSGTNAGTGNDGGLRSTGGQAGDLETRAVPSLNPDQTKVPSRESRSGPSGGGPTGGTVPSAEASGQAQSQPAGSESPATQQSGAGGGNAGGAGADSAGAGAGEPSASEPAGAEGELASLEAEIERLEAEVAETTEERDDLQAELEAVREERDELQAEVERLDTELRRLEEELGAASDADRRMTPVEAIEGTNLFVDYHSKGDATLEKAHGGSESREEVAENLQLGVHTEFDQAGAAVGGQAFGEFLRETLHYRFAEWVVRDLLFEIRDTGHAEALTDLYDAIPEIRRVEFNGTVDVEYVEDGQEKTSREQFDVIFRHRMGDPLVVANLNDARDPATGGMMDTLVTAAERVGQTEDELSAAFLVTSSFFESEALETVSEATRGGILSRDSRASFVNLSRKSGYHLCLTAAREGNFHMEVPEL